MSNRKPNWKKWKLIPNAKVWQVISLSLDIDPDEIKRVGNDWMAGGAYVNHEGREFRDRLDIVKANFLRIDETSETLSLNGVEYCELNIAKFAKWAISNQIEIPDEMEAMADESLTVEKEMFDVNDPKYPIELHIAIKAWQKVSRLENRKLSPKAKIREWLNENYTDKQLSKEAKERISVVANWQKTGGAPSTDK